MKIDQIAFYAKSVDEVDRIKTALGLSGAKWIIDEVTAKSLFPDGHWEVNKGVLQFNYDLGIELEILTYVEGRHWAMDSKIQYSAIFEQKGNPLWSLPMFISHVGIHLEDGEPFPAEMNGCPLVQETFTISHTSEYLTTSEGAGRLYHYRIHEMVPGTYIKYIRRIHPNGHSKGVNKPS